MTEGVREETSLERRSRAWAPLAWIALYVAGQLAAFHLTQLVPFSTFPHLLPWPEVFASRRLELAVLVVQTIAVVVALSRFVTPHAVRRVIASLGAGRLAFVLVVIGASLAIPTWSASRFAGELVLAAWIVAVALGNALVLGRVLGASRLDGASAWVDARVTMNGDPAHLRRWDRALPWLVAGTVTALSASMAWFVLEGVPHIDDSVAYLFQAKTFALGRISVPPPADSASFAVPHLIVTGDAWFAKYFPGWPAVLSLGVLANAAWLVNPLLAGVAILLTHALLRRLYDPGIANVAILLLGASPWMITSSAEMMSHPATLVCALLALLAIDRQRGRRAVWWALTAGLALGMMYLIRPPDAAAFGVVAALWAWGFWGDRLSSGALATVAAVALAVAALSLPYNAALTGDPLLAPHRLWSDLSFGPGVDVIGFGRNVGIPLWRDHDPLPGHGPADIVIHANRNLHLLSSELFGWAAGSLWFVLLAMTLKRERRRADGLMLAIIVSIAALHMAYWYPGGPDLGPRFWYLMIVPLAVFTAQGASVLASQLDRTTAAFHWGRAVAAVILVASLTSLAGGLPWRATKKFRHYREIGGELRALSSGSQWSDALVFIHATDRADYQSAFNFLRPTLDGSGPIFALDAGPDHRAKVLMRYPQRPVWIVGRERGQSGRLGILAGPLPAGVDPRDALQSINSPQ